MEISPVRSPFYERTTPEIAASISPAKSTPGTPQVTEEIQYFIQENSAKLLKSQEESAQS